MTDHISVDIWEELKQVLKKQLSPQSFHVWLEPTKAISAQGNTIHVEVPNNFSKEWLLEHYPQRIKEVLEVLANKDVAVNYVVSKKEQSVAREKTPEPPSPTASRLANFNPKYTFENFVVGSSNRFAHAACVAVAEKPAMAYNPLFLYGGVGLGKTHLMQAIGQHLITQKPDAKVHYISSERFTNQLINAIQNRATLKFREKYRTVDVLLVDDIHFIAGKESTQEEFFHTFNALHDAHKQIVISSDRPPKEIPTLEERLISRFEWGLITDIQPPDFETRVAILKKKAEKEVISVPDEVTSFIAEKIRSNIRELEGALIRVVAYALLVGQEVTLELAQEVLREALAAGNRRRITIDLIQKKVAERFDVRLQDMKVKKRTRAIAYPRQIAMYLSRELTNSSLPEIGEAFGGKDHTTVLYAHDKIKKILRSDEEARQVIDSLVSNIRE